MGKFGNFLNTAAGGAVTGGLMDGIGSLFTIGAQKRAATTAWNRQNEFWDRQNAYNTPKAQMDRLKQAGLNPALMYGQGNTGNAQNLAGVQKANVQGPQLAQSAAAGAQISLVNQQRELMNQQAKAAKVNAAANFMNSMTNKGKLALEHKIAIPTIDNLLKDIQVKDQNISESIQRVSVMELDKTLKQSQINLNIEQKNKVIEESKKILADTALTNKIINQDYSDRFGKNWFVNAENMLKEYNMDNATGVLGTVATLATLRNPASLGKLAAKLGTSAMALKGKINTAIKVFKNVLKRKKTIYTK
jgi:hypothetical protein